MNTPNVTHTADTFVRSTEIDPFDIARATEILRGYTARWCEDDCRVLAVELEFNAPLVNPETSSASPVWRLGGKIDAMVEKGGKEYVVEHKCLAGDARIFDHSSGVYRTAREMFDSSMAPTVTAMDASGRMIVTQGKALTEAGVRRVFAVRTLGGRTLRVSGNHPVFTTRGWVPAEDLTTDDWVATPKHLTSRISDANFTDEAIRMIGYMIGDGCMGNVSFTKKDERVLNDVVRCGATLGEEVSISKPPHRTAYVQFSNAKEGRYAGFIGPVWALMKAARLHDANSATKRIPFHFAMSDRQLGQLVGALWSTDGCIELMNKKARIIYTSVSDGLCCDIQAALQRLGIVSNVRRTSVEYKGERRSVSTVQVVSRESKRRFLSLVLESVIPVLRSASPIADVTNGISSSNYGNDLCLQPTLDEAVWWDRVESISPDGEEMTYDLEVPDAHTFVVEGIVTHNTSSEDLGDGSTYWRRLTLDSQMSTYLVGARAAGFSPVGIIYDVIGKPKLRAKLATPPEARKYTAKGFLFATQRETDETVSEFSQRLREEIVSDPERYFVRGPVVRLEQEEREAARDVWQTAANIRVGRNAGSHPRNPDACFAWNTACTYWDVCSGTTTINDPLRFRRTENVHEELSSSNETLARVSLPILTNSQMSSFRRCQHMHFLRYDGGYRAVQESEARRFGTLIHKGLEQWWLAFKEGAEPRDRFIEAVRGMTSCG